MLNFLLDVSSNTPVAMLPEIVSHNNEAIRNEFDNIYDPDNDRLLRSVYTPMGSVTAYNGVFTNVTIENLILKKPDALQDVIKDTIQYIPHSVLNNRFSTDTLDSAYNKKLQDSYSRIAHDAASIVVPGFKYYKLVEETNNEVLTVHDALTDLYGKYQTLLNKLSGSIATASVARSSNDSEPAVASTFSARSANTVASPRDNSYPFNKPEPITYPANYVYATVPQLRRNGLPKLHISDLLSGNIYTYYNANASLLTVDNAHPVDIECEHIESVFTLCLKQSVSNNIEFKILLERNGKSRKYLKVIAPNPELTRIQLQCKTAYSEAVGTVWEIFGYSLPNPETTLEIINE